MAVATASLGAVESAGAGAAASGSAAGGASAGAGSVGAAEVGSTGTSAAVGGGLLDIISPASYASMGSQMASREESQRQFDITFYENRRRFGMEFALREAALRHNASVDSLRNKFARSMQALGAVQNMKSQALQNRQGEMELAEQQRRKRVSKEFMRGFNAMIKAPAEPGRLSAGGQNG